MWFKENYEKAPYLCYHTTLIGLEPVPVFRWLGEFPEKLQPNADQVALGRDREPGQQILAEGLPRHVVMVMGSWKRRRDLISILYKLALTRPDKLTIQRRCYRT